MHRKLKHLAHCIAILLLVSVLCSCKNDATEQSIVNEIAFSKEGELSIFAKVNGVNTLNQKLDIEIADDEYQIQTGLMHRNAMEEHHGMLFIFPDEAPRSFYMKNTLIPLDIIFITQNNTVLSIQKNAKPLDESSLPSHGSAQYVLEINGGLSDQWNIKAGDSISFIRQ